MSKQSLKVKTFCELYIYIRALRLPAYPNKINGSFEEDRTWSIVFHNKFTNYFYHSEITVNRIVIYIMYLFAFYFSNVYFVKLEEE